MIPSLEQYLSLKEQVEEIEPEHWLAGVEKGVGANLSELLETGSVTTTVGGREFIISLRAQEVPQMQLTAVWNTGRLYTMQGQVIAAVAELTTTYRHLERIYNVTFLDASRHISGVFEAFEGELRVWGLKQMVMSTYDLGEWRDAKVAPELQEKLRKLVAEFTSNNPAKG